MTSGVSVTRSETSSIKATEFGKQCEKNRLPREHLIFFMCSLPVLFAEVISLFFSVSRRVCTFEIVVFRQLRRQKKIVNENKKLLKLEFLFR